MKRFWIGVFLLVLLLGLGVFAEAAMQRIHDPISEALDRAAEAALQEDWTLARELADDAYRQWGQTWHCTAAAADHEPMDEMDMLFGELRIYARQRDIGHFASTCAQLARLADAMGDAHAFNWWNIL